MDPAPIAALLAPFLGDATLSAPQLAQLAAYLDLLLRWNARINLTAIRDPEQIVTRHFGESLFTARALFPDRRLATGAWLLDLGSGAGFPGLPIKLWTPDLRVTLLESQHRKTTFLREVIRALSLTDIDVFPGRAEDYQPAIDKRPSAINNRPSPIGSTVDPNGSEIADYKSQIPNCVVTLRAVERFERALPVAGALLARVPARARTLALLIGAAQVSTARRLLPHCTWSDPLPIPHSAARVLLPGSLR